MRVIAGSKKGHRLKWPKTKDVRPTEDRIKESLFNILGPIDEDSIVLDLFAGTGNIGIEFLSRGGKECYFVDSNKISIDTIKENIDHTKLNKESFILRKDALEAIDYLKNKDIVFDYIYLDPPFNDNGLLEDALDSIAKNNILSEDGMLIVEHSRDVNLEENILDLKKYDKRKYGNKIISFYRK